MLFDGTAALLAFLCAVPIAVWVAWSDLARMKIPNRAVLALLGVFVVLGLIFLPLPVLGWQIAQGAILLVVCFLLSIVGVLGAGDAKFIAVMTPFFLTGDIMIISVIFAIAVVTSFILHRLARKSPIKNMAPNWESWERTKDFPMGVPLALTLIVYLGRGLAF